MSGFSPFAYSVGDFRHNRLTSSALTPPKEWPEPVYDGVAFFINANRSASGNSLPRFSARRRMP